MPMSRLGSLCLWILFAAGASAQQPLLQLQGEPWSQGSMTLHFSAGPGQPALVFYGLDPLDPPLQTLKGPFHVGSLINALPLGTIPALGRIDLPFTLPPLSPSLAGIPMVLQGYVPGALSNPATLPLDQPHHLASQALVLHAPQPTQQGKFGDRMAVGDLNGDGAKDIVVGAWFESYLGIQFSGRVYIFWGPDYAAVTPLASPAPYPASLFGAGVVVADFDGDDIDDLMVGQEGGFQPFAPPGPASMHIYMGASQFPALPTFTRLSKEIAEESSPYGRIAAVADFNEDGYVDIALGLPNAPVGLAYQAGRVRVFWGPDFTTNKLITSPTPQASANFGTALAAGDVTGDGIVDLIEGSGRADIGGVLDVGEIHVYDGNGLGLLMTIQNPLEHVIESRFGDAVHVADIDGDGVGELLSADGIDHGFVFRSFLADDFQVIPKPPASATNPFGETAYGQWISSGDFNGDARTDFLIGDMFEGPLTCPNTSGGVIYIALGPHFSTLQPVLDTQPACGNQFGFRFLITDIDLDGLNDLVGGSAVADDVGLSNSGRVTVLFHQ